MAGSNTINFDCDRELFDRIAASARRENLSIEKYLHRVIREHHFPMEKVRREYRTPRRFYCYEIDPD